MYDFKEIEKKWQHYWEEHKIFEAKDDTTLPKFYALVEFPYPSGAGMHIGHIKAYAGLEVNSRKRRMEGYNVLFPIGFDAFGLPTENYAIKMGIHPRIVTDQNIETFTNQLKKVGFSFDYSRVIDTTQPSYFKWTQWIFLKMFENGLAFRDKTLVNYCPKCKVVLSNEESQGGHCDRCDSEVVQREKDVWFLRITEYADKLLEGLKEVHYLPRVRAEQERWIGKSYGAFVNFAIQNSSESMKIYTTRPDTLFGVTFLVMAPEHPIIDRHKDQITNFDEVLQYREEAKKKSEFERTQLNKEKTGVKLSGLAAVHPITKEEIPIYLSDYVMMGYGTGAIMAVPAHDDRDYEFAKKFDIPIVPVIEGGNILEEAYTGSGKMIHSDFLNGIETKEEAIATMLRYLEEHQLGEAGVQYKMKDWAFNRQRYWGEPIPIIHCPHCGMVPVPYDQLPLELPEVLDFRPGEDGESPLATVDSWVHTTCPTCGGKANRETDTMPQWAGSSWYFLRYIDPHNTEEFANYDKLKYWLPVDWYNGGMEHVSRHLIYSRFWHKFLYDLGLVPTSEPYDKRTMQGLVLASDGSKMSKSKGNVVNPDDVVDAYGADSLRTYILFMGEYSDDSPWSESGIRGCKRFLDRVYRLSEKVQPGDTYSEESLVLLHQTIKKVSNDIEQMKYNTAISALMILLNQFERMETIHQADLRTFLLLLHPFAPHLTEEMNEQNQLGEPLCTSAWPTYEEDKTMDQTYEMVVQVNGKVRSRVVVPVGTSKEDMEKIAMEQENVIANIAGKPVRKVIVIADKLVNIVVA